MAHALRDGGYRTCFVGKWHLLGDRGERNLPQNMGFDVNIAGGAGGMPPTYFYPYLPRHSGAAVRAEAAHRWDQVWTKENW